MKINLHIGVHKTATTFMQNKLHANREALFRAGIGYISLWNFRKFFTEKFMDLTPETFRIEDHLPEFFDGKVPGEIKGLLISEENFIGYCGGLLVAGQPFGSARHRLQHLRMLLGEHEITMFCAVRSYETFLSSAYSEGIRNNNKYVAFEDFRNRLHWGRMQWPYLIDRFEQALKPERTVLWRYEDFRRHGNRILDALTFDAGINMAEPTGKNVEYPSFSKMTVDTLDVLAKHLDGEAANALISAVAATFPKSEAYPALDPWSSGERKLMQLLYAQDCQSIAQEKWLKLVLAEPLMTAAD